MRFIAVSMLAFFTLLGGYRLLWDEPATSAEEVLVQQAPQQCAPIPGGSYRITCRRIQISCDGSLLATECETRAGRWIHTTLVEPFRCGGDIANIDGHLQCR